MIPPSKSPEKAEAQRERTSAYFLLASALILTVLAYGGALFFQFVYDDDFQIVLNPHLQSWRFVPVYFTKHLWSQLYPNDPGFNYRPFFLLWLRLNYALFGLHPWGWHLTTLLVHLAVTALVYGVAHRLVRDPLAAGVATLIFGLHPVHVEAVAWVSGVSEPLFAAFFLLSLLCYLVRGGARQHQRWWAAASWVTFAIATLAKETAVVLPVLIFAYAWLFEAAAKGTRSAEREPRRADPESIGAGAAFKSALPYFAIAVLAGVLRWIVLRGPGAPLTTMPFSMIYLTWPSLLFFYLKLLVWPVGLSGFYDTPYVTRIQFTNFVLPLAVVCLVAAGLWQWSKRLRVAAFPSLWIVGTLAPALNLAYLSYGEIAHDRYLYLPSVGFALLAALALRRLKIGGAQLFGQPMAQVLALLALACVLTSATAYQKRFWADDFVLYERGVETAPNNRFAEDGLASLLADNGHWEPAKVLYQQVLEHYPDFYPSNLKLGVLYYNLGQTREAEQFLSRAVRLNPAGAGALFYLGLTRLKMGRVDDAGLLISRAVELQPQTRGFHFGLGIVRKLQGNLCAALDEFKAELEIAPRQAQALEQIREVQTVLRAEGGEVTDGACRQPNRPQP